ncbi:MAG: hypothetical protein GX847_12700 [Clostridiales bacterium]|nr:hypothetical protein [Clostridiales bacterium]
MERMSPSLFDYALCGVALNIAGVIIDDIYRSVNIAPIYTTMMEDYLSAAAEPISKHFSKIGITIHYLTNNTYSEYTRPLKVFPRLCDVIGFTFISPIHAASHLLLKDGKTLQEFDMLYPAYYNDAMTMVNRIIALCHDANRHYLLLIPDGDTEDFKLSAEMINKKGVLTLFQTEAPQNSPKISVYSKNVL